MNLHIAMLSALTNGWSILKQTIAEWTEDKVPQLGAALAFYTALSIAPLLVISLAVAGMVFGKDAARGEVQQQMSSLVGEQGGKAIEQMIASARQTQRGCTCNGAQCYYSCLRRIRGVRPAAAKLEHHLGSAAEAGRGLMGVIRDRFLSVAMVFGVAFLLLVSLLLSAALTSLATLLNRLPESLYWLSEAIHFGVSFVIITMLFAMMYKYLPDVKIAWRDVWLGAAITAALFTIGKFAIGLYLGHSSMASSYGVAGSFVVLLVWVYYSSQILFFGAEFTQVYANRYGSRIEPSENAEPMTEEAARQQGRPK